MSEPTGGEPASDPEVADFVRSLGVPGIADIHVHFMPPSVMAAVWRYFDSAGPLVGREWPIRYRGTDEERLEWLRRLGVRRFAALSYAHKPGMARWLTDWSLDFSEMVPQAVPTGTFYPEPGVNDYVRDALDRGCRAFKLHVQVGEFDPSDAALDGVWGLLADAGAVTIIHAGSGPTKGTFTGPGPVDAVLRRHPGARLIVAHCGLPEEREFLDLTRRHPGLGLDTTMVGTAFMEQMHRFPRDLLPELRALGVEGRVHYGSDFPNIPYPYAEQVRALSGWDLGEDWLRAVLWDNTVALFGG